MRALVSRLSSNGIFVRVARGASWTALGFGLGQGLRLAANLVLTRLLFPEAFGLMALVGVFMIGLSMFSDVGLGPSILQNKRGDEADFLNTAWTIQVVRGACLWLATCALAVPLAHVYGEPALMQLLPVAGLALLISGFNPTRIWSANRHLLLGRVAAIDLVNQVVSVVILIALAYWLRSVWALAIGNVIAAMSYLVLARLLLPGKPNRFSWDKEAASELVQFGKWIFVSTAVGFVVFQGDKLILAKYLQIEQLGIYNIGFFLASFPMLLGGAVIGRVLIPLYRERPPAASHENFSKIRWMRFALTTPIMAMLGVLAIFGVSIVGLLYDARYAAAGGIVVIIACMQIMQLVGFTYDQLALAAGHSRSFFLLSAARATLQITGLLVGLELAGLLGALAGQCLAFMAIHPLIIRLARRHGGWDAVHDGTFLIVGCTLAAVALWHNWDAISMLAHWP